jgi:hypothetical protein
LGSLELAIVIELVFVAHRLAMSVWFYLFVVLAADSPMSCVASPYCSVLAIQMFAFHLIFKQDLPPIKV